MKNHTLLYIAHGNKRGGMKVLKEAGYPRPPQNPTEMAQMLADFAANGGPEAETKLKAIHPDAAWFSANGALPWLNCGGCQDKLNCLGADGKIPGQPGMMNADATVPGQPAVSASIGLSDKTINIIILSGASLLAVAMLTLIVVNVNK